MVYRVLNQDRNGFCQINLVKMKTIDVKRRPSQIFIFDDPEELVRGFSSRQFVVVYVGEDIGKYVEGEPIAFYWESSDTKQEYVCMNGSSLVNVIQQHLTPFLGRS